MKRTHNQEINHVNPPREWKLDRPSEIYNTHPKWNRKGKFGRNAITDNAHCIEFSTKINGSGKQAMNGCTDWPALDIKIDFLEGQERLRIVIAERIAELINELLPISGG